MDLSRIEVIAPNLNGRLSGVTATIARLIPLQAEEIGMYALGPQLPRGIPRISLWQALTLPRKPRRVWHARRNIEMLLGLFLKYILRKNVRLLFTSASQRHHSAYTRLLLRQMDAIVATSHKTAAYLKQPAIVVPHGIDLSHFVPPLDKMAQKEALGLPQGPILGCFGRIRPQKGTDVFVDALLEILPRHPEVTGLILGRATEKYIPFENELKRKIADLNLEKQILFLGEKKVWEMPQWYQILDLYVAPQRWEGFGLTPLEAMACGVPVMATRVGAFEELVLEGETGCFIPPDDSGALAQALETLLRDPAQRRQWALRARTHVVDHFDLRKEACALIRLYREMLSHAP